MVRPADRRHENPGPGRGDERLLRPDLAKVTGTYAAFSAVGVRPHQIFPNGFPGNSEVADNLNNYIAAIPGVPLTSGLAVDDLWRIIAGGSDGHDCLLTPLALGPAETVPEPSTAWLLGLAGSVLGLRTLRRSRTARAVLRRV